jgi:N-acetyl-anhydromuramyl-L-alanine amidase AmpD
MMRTSLRFLAAALAVTGCGEAELSIEPRDDVETGGAASAEAALREAPTYDAVFQEAGATFGVPPALLKSLAWAETRYEMVQGDVEHDGESARFGLMSLWGDALTQGAMLAGVTEGAAKTNASANVFAAAAYLDALARARSIDRADAEAWATVLEDYSRIEDPNARTEFARREVFGALELGVGAPSTALEREGKLLSLKVPGEDMASLQQRLSAGPDYAPAIWRRSPNFNSRPGVRPKMIIIHTCEGGYSGCWGWLTRPAAKVSAHYVVSTTGEISQLVREGDRAWHVSASYNCCLNGQTECPRNGTSINDFSIGIEHAGFASQSSFPQAQLDASARLVCNIAKDLGIPRDANHIVGHGQLQPGNRVDPGRNWPWASYLARINSNCGSTGTAAPTEPPPVTPTPTPTPGAAIVVDSNNSRNDQSVGYIQLSANWVSALATPGYYGTGYFFAATTSVSDGATFWFKLDAPARKTVDAWWTAGTNRATNAPFAAFNAQGARVGETTVNQQLNGGAWRDVGSFDFTAGWNRVVLSRQAAAGKVVIADAIRIR